MTLRSWPRLWKCYNALTAFCPAPGKQQGVKMLSTKIPGDIERRVRSAIGDERVRYCLASDLTLDRRFGKRLPRKRRQVSRSKVRIDLLPKEIFLNVHAALKVV